MNTIEKTQAPIICFAHLRWDFVFQRPQHLLTRFSQSREVYYFEEPVFDEDVSASLELSQRSENLYIGVPHLPSGLNKEQVNKLLTNLLDQFFANKNFVSYAFWYYTPMALEFTSKYTPVVTVYDCMDELAAFKFAPPELKTLEQKLMQKADVVFTGGHSLYESKKNLHSNIHPFPSSIDFDHFSKARKDVSEPEDQKKIKGTKIGFFGVIDERFNIELIREMASARPDWQIVLIGPVVKIDPATLPQRENIHYLGSKSYAELPAYLSGWDIALIPFLLNESTRFISPTKTPEYLAAGIPVVSSAIRDVVKPYGVKQLVRIAGSPVDFVDKIEAELQVSPQAREAWKRETTRFLSTNSWDHTCRAMMKHVENCIKSERQISIAS